MHSRRRGLFLPVLAWGVVSGLLFLWQFHRTQARTAGLDFTLLNERGEELDDADVTLDGRRYFPGMACGLGWKHLVVQAEGFEGFETNRFVFYGGSSLGAITLPRIRGRMELEVSPFVRRVQITGSKETKTLTNVTRDSISLPVGQYKVEARFARFSIERTVNVTKNQTSHVDIVPTLTALNLISDPDTADFELRSKGSPPISAKGTTPRLLTELPTGDYDLHMSRGAYQKNVPVSLAATTGTNEVKVEFPYTKLSIASEPADAAISDGSKVIGRTPASFALPPGAYRIQVWKEGYFRTNLDLTLKETDSRTIAVTLIDVSFAEALDRARRHSFGGVNNDQALADLDEALRIKPGDETALALKREIQFNQHMRKAWLLERKSAYAEALVEVNGALKLNESDAAAVTLKRELEKAKRGADEQRAKTEQAAAEARAETRRTRPQKVLKEVSSHLRYHELFDEEVSRFKGSVERVHTRLLQALGTEPQWTILRDEKVDDDIRVVIADMTTALQKQRVAIVAGQTTDEDVLVWFKLIVMLGFKGVSENTYTPYIGKNEGGVISRELQRDVQAFKKRIGEEAR